MAVQTHSPNHSQSCRKGNRVCRFGFPKLPANETLIVEPAVQDSSDEEDDDDIGKMSYAKAKKCLAKLTD